MLANKLRKNLAKIITAATIIATINGGAAQALAAGATSTDYVNFRTGPGMGYSVQFVVKPGQAVNIVSDMGYWSKVEVAGKTGYMATEYLKKAAVTTPTPTAPVATSAKAVTTDALNLRASGSLSASVLTVIPRGTTVDVIGSTTGTWINVKYGSRTGWVYSTYVTIAPKTTVPAPTPTPTPAPAPAPTPAPTTDGKYTLKASARTFVTAADAKNGVNSVGSYAAGSYYVYKTYNGMVNISKTSGAPGAWINPGSTTVPATPTTPTTSNPYPGYTKMTFDVTFYTDIPWMNGGYTTTASGKKPAYGMLASNVWPFGTVIEIPGWGKFVVEDRGGSSFNSKNRLDMFIPRKSGESDSQYIDRIMVMGRKNLTGYVKP